MLTFPELNKVIQFDCVYNQNYTTVNKEFIIYFQKNVLAFKWYNMCIWFK